MSYITLAERRSRSTRTGRNSPKPLAVDARDILSGEVPLKSPLQRLTSRRYLEQLIGSPTDTQRLSTKKLRNGLPPGGKSQVQQQDMSENSRDRERIARLENVETTVRNTDESTNEDKRPNKPSSRGRAGEERMFWDSIRTQLKMPSDEDITDTGQSDNQGKRATFVSNTPPRELPPSVGNRNNMNLFQPSS